MEAKGKKSLSDPTSVWPSITTWECSRLPAPNVTFPPMTQYGPIAQPSPIVASGWMTALGWMSGMGGEFQVFSFQFQARHSLAFGIATIPRQRLGVRCSTPLWYRLYRTESGRDCRTP